MAERALESIVDSNGKNETGAGNRESIVVRVAFRAAQGLLSILHHLDGRRRCKHCADVDGHVEKAEAAVTFVRKLRGIVEFAYDHLQVTLKQARAQTDEEE